MRDEDEQVEPPPSCSKRLRSSPFPRHACEFVWVLLRVYDFAQRDISAALDALLDAGLDLGDDRHAGGELQGFAVDHQALFVECDARGIDEPAGTFDIGRLLARTLRALAALMFALRLVDCVMRDPLDRAVDQAVTGEREGVDLDFGAPRVPRACSSSA